MIHSLKIIFFLSLFLITDSGLVFSDNEIYQKNSKFMNQPTLMEDLYQKNSVTTSTLDTLTKRELRTTISRHDLEKGDIAVQMVRDPRFSPQEILRIAEEKITENNITSEEEKKKIKGEVFSQKLGTVDKQAIEGAALAVTNSPPSKIIDIFLKLGNFDRYAPKIFLKSVHLKEEELSKRKITPSENTEFQYSKIEILGTQFAQTLRYEMSSETHQVPIQTKEGKQFRSVETMIVAWEIDPLFKEDPEYKQEGVLLNSGSFTIQPYIDESGIIDPHRSIILYHIYIKLEPGNALIEILHDLFKASVARSILHDLASALRAAALRTAALRQKAAHF